MNVADTSRAAYVSLRSSGKVEDRKDMTVMFLREMGGKGTAFDIIRHVQSSIAFADDEARFRFVQNVHATVSGLTKDGVLKCTGTRVNPTTGQDVKFYEINEGAVVPMPTFEKGYKAKYEAAAAELEVMRGRALAAESKLADSVTKDALADRFYEAQPSNNWDLIKAMFVRR